MAFGQSKYYVDSLSENTKRGLRQKVRMGIFPSQAPVGYLNDSRTKTIVVEKKKSRTLRLAFEKYVKGNMRLEDVTTFLAKNNITTRTGKRISKTKASFILSNPFYIGLFKYGGELHEGKHEPIITKKLFDEAQEMLRKRGQPERKAKNEPQPFCGLISCASCGMMITAENKTKRQKNGNVHEYTYYRCTKKSKTMKCPEMRRIRRAVIISHSKNFFAQRLGGGTQSSCFARPQKFRPVFDCLCERKRKSYFRNLAKTGATS